MSLGIIILSFISAYILSRLLSSLFKPSKTVPPKAKNAWPIIGHLHTKLTHTTLATMADTYGPIFTIQLGSISAVVVSNSEIAKELFTTHDYTVSSRPKLVVSEYFGYNYAMFGLSPYGTYWRDVRKVSTVHLLSNGKLEDLKHIRVSEVDESIRKVYQKWMVQEDGNGKDYKILVEMKQWIFDMTFNISLRMVAGKRCYGSSAKSAEAKRCQEAFRDFFQLLGTPMVADCLPFLRWFDLGGYEKTMKKSSKDLDTIFQGWLDEHKMVRKNQTDNKNWVDQDFMDVLLTVLEGKDFCGYDSDTVNKATCINLIAGGSDTITISIIWALSLLLNNRNALKKVQDELDTQVGRHRKLTESDIPNLPYLQAIIKETLRLYSAAPLAAPHEFMNNCVVAGFHINKGTRLILNLHKIHRDPTVWADPLEFRPERFLTSEVDVQGRYFELIPFGAGRRMCVGMSMALCLMHLGLGSLLHAFEFSTPFDDAPVDMEEGFGLTIVKINPLDVLLGPRLPTNLYL